VFGDTITIGFKNQSGEYPTATGFALWKAASIAKQKEIPIDLSNPKRVRNILIYNHYQNIHHTFQLVSAC